jgi:hypothetical protein
MTEWNDRAPVFRTRAWRLLLVLFLAALGVVALFVTQRSAIPLLERVSLPRRDPIEQALDRMPWGNIAFNSPKFLGYGRTVVVDLLLSGNKTGDQLLSLIDEDGDKETYRVQFNRDMEARLVGSAFDITPITSERQLVSPAGVAEWKWEVRAKEFGEQRLFLTLNAHLKINGQEGQHTVKTFSKTIDVNVVWPQSATFFLWNYWQWLCSAVAIPFIVWLGSRIFRSRATTGQGIRPDDPDSGSAEN